MQISDFHIFQTLCTQSMGNPGIKLSESWSKFYRVVQTSMSEGIGRERQQYLRRTIVFSEYMKLLEQWQVVHNLQKNFHYLFLN